MLIIFATCIESLLKTYLISVELNNFFIVTNKNVAYYNLFVSSEKKKTYTHSVSRNTTIKMEKKYMQMDFPVDGKTMKI